MTESNCDKPDTGDIQPITVYGSDISYFTGKLENYFRVRGIPYQLRSMQLPADNRRLTEKLGLWQMPSVELGDGRWMTDTSAIIQWFEAQYSQQRLVPADPLQAFVCYLLEDWADEWWWRPAMHYRWHYAKGAQLQSRHLADQLLGSVPVPGSLKRIYVRSRQRSGYATGDGITRDNVAGVEAMYLRLLDQLQSIFSRRTFLLGGRPSLADIGLSGPFFRHFALDPVPLEIIRERAPAVLEWVARLWNTDLAVCSGDYLPGIPEDLGPLLDDIGSSYLPYLCDNADAVAAGRKRFDTEVGGVFYRGARYSRYRVWCLQELRGQFQALPEAVQLQARKLLQRHGCWEPLWRQEQLPLLPGQEEGLPFHASFKMVGVNE
jgi:glutathione S-transferase